MKALVVNNVSVLLGGVKVLDSVSFSADTGSVTALIGPSGSGKSTLASVITGERTPSEGSVEVSGVSSSAVKVGFVPQFIPNFSTLSLSVSEMVALGHTRLGLFTSSSEKSRVSALLEILGLQDYSTRTMSELSGGQRQRVAIARALMSGSNVLVCDEPTSGADPVLANDVMDALLNLSTLGTTVIIATHDVDRVVPRCNRAVALKDGRVVFLGAASSLSKNSFNEIYATERRV